MPIILKWENDRNEISQYPTPHNVMAPRKDHWWLLMLTQRQQDITYLQIEMPTTKEIVFLKKKKYGPESFLLISLFSPRNVEVNVAC